MELTREQRDKEWQALNHLLHSEGWEAVLQLLTKVCLRKEVEKSNRLRKGALHEAVVMQGEIDGLNNVLVHIENYMRELQPQEEPE